MKHTLLIVLGLLGAAALAGCESTGPSNPMSGPSTAAPGSEAFSDQDFAWSTQGGGDSLDGVVAYKGGPAAYTCGNVVLMPLTPWSRARMRVLYGSDSTAVVNANDVRARTPQGGPDYRKYAKITNCDAADHFSFSGLPDGTWFLITAATPVGGGDQVAIMRRVDTRGSRRVTLP
jgi:hypothetical protein